MFTTSFSAIYFCAHSVSVQCNTRCARRGSIKYSMQYAVNNTPLECCFKHVQSLDPTAESLEEFRNFRFINDDTKIANLAEELPAYLAAADGVAVTCEEDKVTWWAAHAGTLPHWSSVVKTLLLIQPSLVLLLPKGPSVSSS